MWPHAFFACSCPILFECGALYRLFLLGFCQDLLLSKRKSTPHFLFYNNRTLGVDGQNYYLLIMSVYEFEQRFLDEHLEEILQKLGREFISDSFVKMFEKCYPQEYGNALRKSPQERGLNVWIARWYLSRCPRVRKGELSPKPHTTTNNNTSYNRLWVKI